MNDESFKLRIGIIISRFNWKIGENLLKGCLKGLKELKIQEKNIKIVEVPGAFEIPLIAKKLARTKKYQALIALGCVIKGETDHHEQICRACVDGIMRVQLNNNIPIVFEVLMVNKEKDALVRSSLTKIQDNKGYIAAKVAVTMAELGSRVLGLPAAGRR